MITSFLAFGKSKEVEFAKDFIAKYSISENKVKFSSTEEDINDHIDLWIGNKSFDVKAAKRINRFDVHPCYSIHWIELRNVQGQKGWLFGHAHYIAFELEDNWCVCPRTSLITSLRGKVDFSSFTTNREDVFKIYRRKNRLDAIVKVNVKFLTNIPTSVLIPKH